MNQALLSSKKMDYCTPQDFFDELDKEFHFVLDNDGLNNSLVHPVGVVGIGGAVFCNPPYGREIGKWVKKAYEEAQKGITVILLIPYRTDTTYFHDYIYGKAEIRFIRGRLRFTDEDGKTYDPAPFSSMVVIYNNPRKGQREWIKNLTGNSIKS